MSSVPAPERAVEGTNTLRATALLRSARAAHGPGATAGMARRPVAGGAGEDSSQLGFLASAMGEIQCDGQALDAIVLSAE